MFEIGSSLREARLRQGLDFPAIEAGTKIRGKYLRALEDEQFAQLPAQTYVKGFLRTYAEYLGLDGELYVDEFNSRYVVGEEEPPIRAHRTARPHVRKRVQSNVLLARARRHRRADGARHRRVEVRRRPPPQPSAHVRAAATGADRRAVPAYVARPAHGRLRPDP